jgi:hypothetical protein
MFRLTIFIIALLLLAGAVEPTKAWFIALSVVSGLSLFLSRPFGWFRPWRHDRFARRMARRFERNWSWEADW